jgi:hypothetical protein
MPRRVLAGAIALALAGCVIQPVPAPAPAAPAATLTPPAPAATPKRLMPRFTIPSIDLALNEEADLSAYLRDADGNPIPVGLISWIPSNTAKLALDIRTGHVKATGTGESVVAAIVRGEMEEAGSQARIMIKVSDQLVAQRVVVTPATLTLAEGQSEPLRATVQMANGETTSNVVWSSEDDTIAAVNRTNGVASGLKAGKTRLVATFALDDAMKGYCDVTVTAGAAVATPTPAPTPTPDEEEVVFGPDGKPL